VARPGSGGCTSLGLQVQKIRLLFRERGLGAIRVGTVDDYQGQVHMTVGAQSRQALGWQLARSPGNKTPANTSLCSSAFGAFSHVNCSRRGGLKDCSCGTEGPTEKNGSC
jgi:hypothetical protein